MTPTPSAQESSTSPQRPPAGKPRAKSGRRAKAKRSAKGVQPGQQAFVFEGLPTRGDKAKAESSKRNAPVTNAAALRAGTDKASPAARVNYVQQELDLGA